ncbi:MAG: ABC transporter substrate-binding protein [Candidatus Aenigmarchaeota archaeon]|nr:ABC transporter substrate-binding protein [Candidatus Aenigmarchaeota archaeon]
MKRVIGIVALIVLLVVGTYFLAHQFVRQDNSQKESVKIGFIGPLSGELAVWGSSQQGGVRLAVEEINNAGGINGKKLEVAYEDDQCDKTKSVTALRKLIDFDKVRVVIGPLCSGTVIADAPVAEQSEVILFGFGSAAAISTAGDYTFRPSYSDVYQGEFLAGKIAKRFNSIGILYVNNDYGLGLFSGLKAEFVKNGKNIVATETYSLQDKDWRTQLAKIKSAQPDALILISYGREGGLIARQAREIGIGIQIIGTDNFGTVDVLEAGGEAVENVIFTSPATLDETKQAVKDFRANYIRINGVEPPIIFVASNTYDTTKIIANAVKTAGTNAEKIKMFLYEMPPYHGVSGVIKFDVNGDATKDFVFQVIRNGVFLPYDMQSFG